MSNARTPFVVRFFSATGRTGWIALVLFALLTIVAVPVCHLMFQEGDALFISTFYVTLIGKIMCYAIVAVAMDLIWGYAGVLSLAQGLFFALGGYAFGMYLMRSIGLGGVYQSHLKIWNLIKSDSTLGQDEFVLILEDDARPSNYFLSEAFQSGEFRNILDWLYKHKPHGFYWGRANERIRGSIQNEFINKPDLTVSYGAHAYMLNCGLINILVDNGSVQNMAADVFIDYQFQNNIKGMYSPYYSFIRQESHILGQQWFSDDDVNRIYGSTTQPEWNGSDIEARDFEGIYEHVTSEMKNYISDAKYIKDMDFGMNDWISFQLKKSPSDINVYDFL